MLASTPLTVTIGSEVHGVDLGHIDTVAADHVYDLLIERAVLVFRDQTLAPSAHVAVAESFGPLSEVHPLYPHVEGYPIARIRTDPAHPPESEVWHSDLSCREAPPFVSVLRAVELPPVGGDTLWADMRAVHDAMPSELRDAVASLHAEHTLEHGFRFLKDFGQTDRQDSLTAAERAKNTSIHPVIAQHPATGRSLLFVNESFTTRLLGVDSDVSAHLLSRLVDFVRNPRFHVRVRWQPGTVVIWDNWATQHFAVGDYFPAFDREVQRITVAGDRRSGPFGVTTPSTWS